MQFPSQEASQAQLLESAQNNPLTLLEGLSGAGKSLIAEQVASTTQSEVIEAGEIRSRLDDMRDEQKRAMMKLIILAHPDSLARFTGGEDLALNTVQVKGLTEGEVMYWLGTIEPALNSEEIELIMKYSLGIPLLIENMCKRRPLDDSRAFVLCSQYANSIIESSTLTGNDFIEKLQGIVARFTHFKIPDDVIANLSTEGMLSTPEKSPISLLRSCLRREKALPEPATLQIFELYTQWMEDRPEELKFDMFLQHCPDAEKVLAEIGYCQYPEWNGTLLDVFSRADARKGATFYPRFGGSMIAQMDLLGESCERFLLNNLLTLARASGAQAKHHATKPEWSDRYVHSIETPEYPSPLYIHKHDHYQHDVVPVAYVLECYFQSKQMPYVVSYDRKLFRYDPKKKMYEPLTVEKWADSMDEQFAGMPQEPDWLDEE